MKKILCLMITMACISICKAQNNLGNSGNVKLNTPAYNTAQPATNTQYRKDQYDPNQNANYNNNSQQYNKGNTIKNAVPEDNGASYTPGAQGTNNTNNPARNTNSTPGTINPTNGVYTQPASDKK